MNTASHSPRFTCRVVRLWSSMSGSTPAAHCATCPDCQAFFAAGDALENALRRAAPHAATTPMIGLDQRIARAVRESQPQRERRSTRVPLAIGIGAGAAAALAVAVVINRPAPSREDTADLAQAVLGAASDLSASWETKVVPATQTAVTNNPLAQELDSVVANGRGAVAFLAANFLPSRNG